MFFRTARGSYVQLGQVAELYLEHLDDGVWLVAELVSGIIKPLHPFPTEADAHGAIGELLAAIAADQPRPSVHAVGFAPPPGPGAPGSGEDQAEASAESTSSVPPAPGKLSQAELEQLEAGLADAGEQARAINAGAAAAARPGAVRGDGDPIAGGRLLR